MLAKRAHHVSFAVRDLAKSIEFYQGLLGFETAERPELGIPGAWLSAGNAQVHLIQTPEGVPVGTPPPGISPLANHVAFAIEDYAAAVALLEQRGVEALATSPEQGQVWIRDPDGNVIELIDPRGRGAGAR